MWAYYHPSFKLHMEEPRMILQCFSVGLVIGTNFLRPKRRGLLGYECQYQLIGGNSVPFPIQIDGIISSNPISDTKLTTIARLLGLVFVPPYYMIPHRRATHYSAMG